MSATRSLSRAMLLCGALTAPVQAERDLLQHFAVCAGRFSAQMEHSWLTGAGHPEQLSDRRDDFVDLLDALVPPDGAGDALARRIEAKHAHALLLQRATFAASTTEADRARRRAQAALDGCAAMLLSPPDQRAEYGPPAPAAETRGALKIRKAR